jgi:hypothetical protein
MVYEWINRLKYEEVVFHGNVVGKNYKASHTSSKLLPVGGTFIPTSSTSPEEWILFVEIESFKRTNSRIR